MKNLVHIAFVKDGAIVHFPHSAYEYMKVCDKNGIGGVVCLLHGEYINTRDLEAKGLGVMCEVVRQMVANGTVVRTKEKRKTYFSLA